jgi:hypothetical protein
MSNTNKQQNTVIDQICNSQGRFFGLYTTNRPAMNAQFKSETKSYVMIYDRNARTQRKLAKSSIIGVSIGGRVFGQAY